MKINQLIKFEPILKDKIWGGEKLASLLNKQSKRKDIGESWEISDVEGDTSMVTNGHLKGKNLKELISEFKSDLVGDKIYTHFGEKFPLLIKFIDAKEALSIQLHPNDTLAKERHNSFGKTEMWYVMQADKNANITYRIYDWDRPNPDGTFRDLHTEEAIDAIDYSAKDSYKTVYSKKENASSEIVSCQYFTTNVLPIKGELSINHQEKDSFVIYMCVEGNVTFQYENQTEKLKTGETILVPACIKNIKIIADEVSELLEVYIK